MDAPAAEEAAQRVGIPVWAAIGFVVLFFSAWDYHERHRIPEIDGASLHHRINLWALEIMKLKNKASRVQIQLDNLIEQCEVLQPTPTTPAPTLFAESPDWLTMFLYSLMVILSVIGFLSIVLLLAGVVPEGFNRIAGYFKAANPPEYSPGAHQPPAIDPAQFDRISPPAAILRPSPTVTQTTSKRSASVPPRKLRADDQLAPRGPSPPHDVQEHDTDPTPAVTPTETAASPPTTAPSATEKSTAQKPHPYSLPGAGSSNPLAGKSYRSKPAQSQPRTQASSSTAPPPSQPPKPNNPPTTAPTPEPQSPPASEPTSQQVTKPKPNTWANWGPGSPLREAPVEVSDPNVRSYTVNWPTTYTRTVGGEGFERHRVSKTKSITTAEMTKMSLPGKGSEEAGDGRPGA